MKRTVRRIGLALSSLLLCAVLLLGAVWSQPAEAAVDSLDYGSSSASANEEWQPSVLFEALFGDAPSIAEQVYLDQLSGISFRYNSTVPNNVIKTDYNGDAGTLSVRVSPHRFVANNGAEVVWIPVEATIDGQTVGFDPDGDEYVCSLENMHHTGDFYMEVRFTWTVELPQDQVALLLNRAYEEAVRYLPSVLEYEDQKADFDARMQAYLTYQAYAQAKADYAAYLAACEMYEVACAEYEVYLEKYELYSAQLELFEAWEAFYAYEDFKTNQLEAYQAYVAYKQTIDRIQAKLNVLEKLFVFDSREWQFYQGLMGTTVTSVVDRKAELITAGCDSKDINQASDATVALRALMKSYATLRKPDYESAHKKTTVLYTFYTENYAALKAQFGALYGALKSLYGNTLVVTKLQMEGKLEHFQQFIGQLYITVTALDDTVKRQSTWTIGKLTLEMVVEECQMIPDSGTADPSELPMPKEVTQIEAVPEVSKPAGSPIRKPTPPTVVAEPQRPTVVANPDLGVIPPYAEKPTEEPIKPTIDVRVEALIEAVRAGTLQARTLQDRVYSLTLEKTVSRTVSLSNKKLVTFYDEHGNLLEEQLVDYGTTVYYHGPSVSVGSNPAQYHYQFLGWVLPDGTRSDMIADKDLSLYPSYQKTLRFYSVTWILNGEVRTESVAYGVLPKSPFRTDKAPDAGYVYTFSGWDHEVLPVTENVTYIGTLEKIPKQFTITWDLGDRVVTVQTAYGEVPICPVPAERAPDDYLYRFHSWSPNVERVTRDATYTAVYLVSPLASASDGSAMRVIYSEDAITLLCAQDRVRVKDAAKLAQSTDRALILDWGEFQLRYEGEALQALVLSIARGVGILETVDDSYGTVYRYGYFDSLDQRVYLGLEAAARAGTDAGGAPCYGFLSTVEGWLPIEGDEVPLADGERFRISRAYMLNVAPVDRCNLAQLPVMAGAGTLIDLRLKCEFGYEVSSARVTLADGTEVTVDGLTFLMPQGAVSIELFVTRIVYHVTFVADGKILFEKDYFLGEEIEIPTAPVKESDEFFDYTFLGWSKDVTIALGDDRAPIYEAQFSKSPISDVDPYLSGRNNNMLLTVILPIAGVVLVLLIAFLLVKHVLKKRKAARLAKEESAQDPTEDAILEPTAADVTEEEEPSQHE